MRGPTSASRAGKVRRPNPCAQGGVPRPVRAAPARRPAAPRHGRPRGGAGIVGGAFLPDPPYPAYYRGAALLRRFVRGWIGTCRTPPNRGPYALRGHAQSADRPRYEEGPTEDHAAAHSGTAATRIDFGGGALPTSAVSLLGEPPVDRQLVLGGRRDEVREADADVRLVASDPQADSAAGVPVYLRRPQWRSACR